MINSMTAALPHLAIAAPMSGSGKTTIHLTLGYRTVHALDTSWLWQAGETLRGHEFHYSTWNDVPATLPSLYSLQPDALRPETRSEGSHTGNLVASYVHLHFLAKPELAGRFVTAARAVEGSL